MLSMALVGSSVGPMSANRVAALHTLLQILKQPVADQESCAQDTTMWGLNLTHLMVWVIHLCITQMCERLSLKLACQASSTSLSMVSEVCPSTSLHASVVGVQASHFHQHELSSIIQEAL